MKFVENKIQKATQHRKHYNKDIPEKIRKEVAQDAMYNGTQAAVKYLIKSIHLTLLKFYFYFLLIYSLLKVGSYIVTN